MIQLLTMSSGGSVGCKTSQTFLVAWWVLSKKEHTLYERAKKYTVGCMCHMTLNFNTIYCLCACRNVGSRWALEQAKYNLVNEYLLVGVTEELEDFIMMLEAALPRFFRGATDLYRTGNVVFDLHQFKEYEY